MNVIPVNHSEDDLNGVFGHVSYKYTPIEGIQITLPGCISSSCTLVPMHIDSSVEILDLCVSLIQEEILEFKYNVDPSRPFGQDSLKSLKLKEKTEVLVLYSTTFDNISESGLYWISHSEPLTKSWDIFIEDLIVSFIYSKIQTKPAIIKHEFRITIKTSNKSFEASTPVIVYNMPLFPDDETIVDTISEINSLDIARAAENDSDLRRREV